MKKGKRKRTRVGRTNRGRRTRGTEDEEHAPRREKILRGRSNEGQAPAEASLSELAGDVRGGQVVAIRGAEVVVEPEEGGPVACILRKSTRFAESSATALVVGDLVRYVAEGDPPFVLAEVLPRRTRLSRDRRGGEQILCANVDLGVIVVSADQPPFKPRLVDRYLISIRQGGLEPVLVLNKVDLVPPERVDRFLRPYRALGFPVVGTSVVTGEGMAEFENVLRSHTAVVSGQSGVGKSSLLNRLVPDLELATDEVYGRVGKGRHTTSASTLYRLPFGGAVVDTPGIRSFALYGATLETLLDFFPEIGAAADGCRYGNCAHRGEDGCALPAAIRDGEVQAERLESFRVLQDELEER